MNKLTMTKNNKVTLNYFCTEQDALNRLAEYENIGLSPVELKALIKQYKEDYKLGDTLYVVPAHRFNLTEPLTATIKGIFIESNMLLLKVLCLETNDVHYINTKNIGRVAFYNKEDAIAAFNKLDDDE